VTESLRAAFLTFSLAQAGWQVLGSVLIRSESHRSFDPNNSTSQDVSRPLRCEISTRLMSAWGQKQA